MALLFMDSFDHYVTADQIEKWTAVGTGLGASMSIAAGTGRRASGSLRFNKGANQASGTMWALKNVPASDATAVLGFALTIVNAATIGSGLVLASIRDGATPQLTLRVNSSFTFSVVRGGAAGTVLDTTSVTIPFATYFYLEWKSFIHASAGTIELRINGVPVLSRTSLNTQASGLAQWTNFMLGQADNFGSASGGNEDYDDLYVLDGTGSAPFNTFLGDCRVDARYPTTENPANSAWTPLSGTDNALMVDETAPDDDSTYNSALTVGAVDTHVVQDAPVAGFAPYAAQLVLSHKKSDAGPCGIAPVVRHSGVDYVGATVAPSVAYVYAVSLYALNPGTGAAWTEAEFNAAEFGYKRTA